MGLEGEEYRKSSLHSICVCLSVTAYSSDIVDFGNEINLDALKQQ